MLRFKIEFVKGNFNRCKKLMNIEKRIVSENRWNEMNYYIKAKSVFNTKIIRLKILKEHYFLGSQNQQQYNLNNVKIFDMTELLQINKPPNTSNSRYNKRNLDILSNICSLKQCRSLKCNRKDRLLYKCNGCNNVRYCTRKCQKYDWINRHKDICTRRK